MSPFASKNRVACEDLDAHLQSLLLYDDELGGPP
eukprot:02828.XXX_57503_59087_1 [CDS] Oithona nana genome sequencing.